MNSATRTLPLRSLFWYGVGGIGWEVFRDTPALLLPVFLITVLGVEPWLAGLCILIPKLWIIFWDPLIGMIADRHKSRRGYQPFLMTGAVLTGLGFIALFAPPSFPTPLWAAAYALIMFGVASTAFSTFSVPYLTMVAAISSDLHERTKILAFRQVFANIGLLLGVGLAQPIVSWAGDGRPGYAVMALVLGSACALSMLSPALGVKTTQFEPAAPAVSILTQFREAARNRPFVILSATFFSFQLGQGCAFSVFAFYFIYIVKSPNMIFPTVVLMCVGAILSQPLAVSFAKRFGKVAGLRFGIVLWSCLVASWLITGGSSIEIATLPVLGTITVQTVVTVLRSLAIGFSGSFFGVLPMSMLTDVIKYDRETFGGDRGGVLAGLFSAVEKVAFATAPLITGIILSAFGFVSSVGVAAQQSSSAITGVLISQGVAPPLIASLSLVLLKRFQLYPTLRTHGVTV